MPLSRPVISRVAPLNVGGAANAGAGFLASAFDHRHPLTETSGPTDLSLGDIIANDTIRRVGGNLVGRTLLGNSSGGNSTTTATTASDVNAALNFAINNTGTHYALWVLGYNTVGVSVGLMLGVNYSGTLSGNFRASVFMASAAAAMYNASTETLDALLGQATVGPGAGDRVALVFARLPVAGPGTLALRYASGVAASQVMVTRSSFGILLQQ